jgi:hypothetical protein
VSRSALVWYQSVNCPSYDCGSGVTAVDQNVPHDELNSSGIQTDGATHGDWWNHERCAGIVHTRPSFGCFPLLTTDIHVSHSGDSFVLSNGVTNWATANGLLEIKDPTFVSNILFSGDLTIMAWGPTYGGNASTTATAPVVTNSGSPFRYRWNQYGTWYLINA